MIKKFCTGFTAALTAVALAAGSLTATVTPAAAMNDKDKAALGVVLGIGALALIANSQNDDSRVRPRPRPQPYDVRPGRRDDWRWDDGWTNRRDERRREARRTIPERCLVNTGARSTRNALVAAHCAADAVGWRALPINCKINLRNDRARGATLYRRSCLEDYGFRIGHR
ncbi:hypothetical protein [Rhodobacter sp. TJ_12]|uniref:hypothetical protein n=1 Tax=Rhodobacter sp. TJ_12 TaxID=2029399 RepID=UPI001CBBA26A|nr:hypothetical protein [Rhodobacter sp. TJ_12]